MRLQPNQKLFGFPALEIRRLMRECGFSSFSLGIVANTLKITRPKAKKLASALAKEGFFVDSSRNIGGALVRVHAHGESDLRNFYELTLKGHALRMATARKPIKRATAERMVSQFLDRVQQVNRDPDLLLWIDEVVVFGSFVGIAPKLSDIDLAVAYTPRIEDRDAWQQVMFARARLAEANGRCFRSFLDRLGWPQREIELQLRKGLPAIHLHDLREEGSFIRTIPSKQLYVRPQKGLVICPKCKHNCESVA